MSQTEDFQVTQTENILKQLQGLDEYGYDLKNLTSVLASLHLFRQKDDPTKPTDETSTPQKDENDEEETSLKSKNSKNEPRLIGAVSKNKKKNKQKETGPKKSKTAEKIASPSISGESVGSGSDNGSKTSSKASSAKSSKRGSRGGNRRARRRRLAKQRIQAKLAADLLSRMTNDGKNKLDDGTASSDATSEATSTIKHPHVNKVVAPPPEFYKYPQISPKRDFLRDPVTGENRPVWCVTIPMVCDKTNTPFYAQCSTSKQGYCTRCGVLRKGHAKTGSVCTEQGCNERLTAKYHRWFPGLIRLEPYGKERTMEDYAKHKDLFKKFNITWNSDDELQFVVDSYLLLKVFVVSPDFDVAPLHLERSYMIGVFAGRAFQTGALARKFLRDGLKLMNFRADYPAVMRLMANYRANIVEELNQIFFQGRFRCYFHAHQTNVEGWYDPTQVDPSTIKAYFKEICDRHMSVGCLKEEKKSKRKSSSRSRSSKSSIPRVNYPKNPGRFDFAKKKMENDKECESDDDNTPRYVPSAPPGFEPKKSSSSKGSRKSSSSKKRKSKRKEETPTISYVPVYMTPQMMNGQQMMMAPNGQQMMMAPNGQPMMMAAAPQPYVDPRTQAAPHGYQYAPVSYAMPQQQQPQPQEQQQAQYISPQQQPVQNYYQQHTPQQPAQNYYGNGYNYGYGYNYGNYGYGYQGYGAGVQTATGTGATSPSESSNSGSQIGSATTPYFVPAGYGQPVDIPSETQPGAQSLNKPIYPEHFVPVGGASTTTEEK